jgi:surfeit locus 1 family protein
MPLHKQAAGRKSLAGPTIFTIFGLALLLGLGTWQVQRLHWKEGLIAQRAAGVAAPSVALPRNDAAAQGLEFHHVEARGHYVGRTLYVHAISLDGAEGYHAITALALDGGGVVLIDRGFVPGESAPAIKIASPAGEVEAAGLLRLPAKPSWFTPDNAPATDTWFYVDPGAMAKATGVGDVLPFYVDQDRAADPKAYPIGGQTPLDLPNHHLQYALTWYALAAALVIFYILLLRRQGREPP